MCSQEGTSGSGSPTLITTGDYPVMPLLQTGRTFWKGQNPGKDELQVGFDR